MTLAEVLQHTSGLPDYSQAEAFQRLFGAHPHAYVSPRAWSGTSPPSRSRFAPGSAYEYSNTDNVVVGLVAAAAEGRNYSQVLRRRVYRPLRLRDTTLPVGFRLPAPHVHGYALAPPEPPAGRDHAVRAWPAPGPRAGSSRPPPTSTASSAATSAAASSAPPSSAASCASSRATPSRRGPASTRPGSASSATGPGCGTVYGHTGNIPGFTQFTAASRGGRRSVTVSVNAQVTPGSRSARVRAAFRTLRRTEALAVCAALAGR